MGNDIQKCCRTCMKLQVDQFILQTRFKQISGTLTQPLRCRKFYISSQPLKKQKINELIIFTDSSLTMSIPNFNIKLTPEQLEILQQTVRYEIYNNNLSVKQNCFVLNAIQEEIDSQYDQFKQFPQNDGDEAIVENVINMNVNNNTSKDNDGKTIGATDNNTQQVIRQKLHNEIQQFALRTKSRAFRFKNPLKNYQIGQIIVAIVPVFQQPSQMNQLKQSIQQALSMSQDMKSVGVAEISFMLGYEQSIFQKIVIQYIMGYSRSKKQYVFKRVNQFVYMTRSNEQIDHFLMFLNVYEKNMVEKMRSGETLGTQRRGGMTRLGKDDLVKNKQGGKGDNIRQAEDKRKPTTEPTLPNLNLNDSNRQNNSLAPIIQNNSFGNTTFHSYSDHRRLLSQRPHNTSQPFINLSRRGISANEFINGSQMNINDVSEIREEKSEIRSGKSDSSEVNKIRIRQFRSKQSNVSDYF